MEKKDHLKTIDLDDSEMENVELHRAQSMVNDEIDIPIKDVMEIQVEKKSTVLNIGSRARTFCQDVQYLKVEVIMFLYMFSYTVRQVLHTPLMIEKVCLVHLARPESECNHLDDYRELKEIVEKMANNYHLGHTLLSMVPSAILALFIGSWSDRYSRKIPIMVALIGIIIDGFGSTICAYILKSRVEYYYIPAIFTGFSGGFIGVLMVLYSYASDVSSAGNRTMRYALMEMAFGISMPLGSLAGGWIFKFFGYVSVYLTSTCGHIIGLFWVIFVIEETRGLDNKDSWKEKLRNFWSTDSVVESFKATIKRRPNRGREQIWWLIVAMSIAVLTFASTAGIGYLYVYHRYNWDATTYSTVSAIFSVMGLIVMMICVPLSKKFNVSDAILGIVGSVSLVARNICMGLATRPHFYFLALLLGLFGSLGTLAGRSKISKVASKEDLGKVFGFLTSAESILPIVAIALVSQGFNASLRFFPGLIFIVTGVLAIIPALVFIWITLIPNANYVEMTEEGQEENTTEEVTEKETHFPLEKSLKK